MRAARVTQALAQTPALPLAPGSGSLEWHIGGYELRVFTYCPANAGAGILVLFDGLHRNAAELRDKAVALAEGTGLVCFSPLLDRERFPKWRYDTAGVSRRGELQARENWIAPLLQELITRAREGAAQPAAPVYLFGHSAGGQLLSRVCAYSPLSDIRRIVITNPSAYVTSDLAEAAPFGFAGLFTPAEALARLQVYLALPLTIYLGGQDTGKRHLVSARPARRQGAHRLERGRNVFDTACALAASHGWAFNWQRVEVADVGHSSRAMLKAPQCAAALGIHCPPAQTLKRQS